MMDWTFDTAYGSPICGIDEAGRGPWAGSVVAAAVQWRVKPVPLALLNDSKKLDEKKRATCLGWIEEHAYIGIGEASPEEIDQMNILQASMLAMQRAFAALGQPCLSALVDGNRAPKLPCSVHTVIKGDATSPLIAAASIVAKEYRDAQMRQMDVLYPHYGFAAHKGYGTPAHQQALKQYGACPIHRQSFAPIRALAS